MGYNIPLFNLNFDVQEELAVLNTIKSGWISMGPKCKEFEDSFSDLLNVKYSLALSNCTVALHLALTVLGITQEDEVIVPSLTFAATANCVKYVGAKPIFADIESIERPVISAEDIKKKITSRTKAIIVMHYAGFACDMDSILQIAKEHSLKIIEDACHAPLSEYKGRKLGTIGDIGCFSFFSNKNISTGEGGMLITNNFVYYEKSKLLRSHGMTTMSYQRSQGHATKYDIVDIGYNYRMDDIRASIGIVQVLKLEDDIRKRIKVREWYLREFEGNKKIIIPFKLNEDFVSNYIMPIVLDGANEETRDLVRSELEKRGIQTSIHYPCVHKFSCYNDNSTLPLTELISKTLITLPMYGSLTEVEVCFIAKSLNEIYS